MNMLADASVDYGTLGPEDVDRFGTKQEYRVWMRGDPYDHRAKISSMPAGGVIRRLGLFLHGWGRAPYHNTHVYHLEIHGRPLQVRRYADGRIKLFLDGQPVYTENIKVVTRHGQKFREIEKYHDPAVADEEEYQRKQLDIEAVRQRLRDRRGR